MNEEIIRIKVGGIYSGWSPRDGQGGEIVVIKRTAKMFHFVFLGADHTPVLLNGEKNPPIYKTAISVKDGVERIVWTGYHNRHVYFDAVKGYVGEMDISIIAARDPGIVARDARRDAMTDLSVRSCAAKHSLVAHLENRGCTEVKVYDEFVSYSKKHRLGIEIFSIKFVNTDGKNINMAYTIHSRDTGIDDYNYLIRLNPAS